MRATIFVMVLMACGDNARPPPDVDAAPVENWTGWGAFCDRPIYGAVTCPGPDDQRGWCVNVESWNRCEPACAGVNFECSIGCRHFYEGNECYCLPCD